MVNINNKNMRTMILIISMCSMNFLMSCCSELFPDEQFTLERKPYIGNELRMDGYYEYFFSEWKSYGTFMYRNGIILDIPGKDGDYSEKRYSDQDFIEYIKSKKYSWSIFMINERKITIQGWGDSGGGIMPVVTRYGNIINDTTFVLIKSIVNNNERFMNEIYYFKPFTSKPDSTNVYIK
jgi:hypothetical protein